MQDVLVEIAKQTPLTAALIWVIIYFKAQLKEEREEVKELNMIIREQQKENIEAMNECNNVMKELTSVIKYGKS